MAGMINLCWRLQKASEVAKIDTAVDLREPKVNKKKTGIKQWSRWVSEKNVKRGSM